MSLSIYVHRQETRPSTQRQGYQIGPTLNIKIFKYPGQKIEKEAIF